MHTTLLNSQTVCALRVLVERGSLRHNDDALPVVSQRKATFCRVVFCSAYVESVEESRSRASSVRGVHVVLLPRAW